MGIPSRKCIADKATRWVGRAAMSRKFVEPRPNGDGFGQRGMPILRQQRAAGGWKCESHLGGPHRDREEWQPGVLNLHSAVKRKRVKFFSGATVFFSLGYEAMEGSVV